MTCGHQSCTCQITGCGLDHARGWKPTVKIAINGIPCGGDDLADCMAHYLLQAGYPTDQPRHLRTIAEGLAAKRAT